VLVTLLVYAHSGRLLRLPATLASNVAFFPFNSALEQRSLARQGKTQIDGFSKAQAQIHPMQLLQLQCLLRLALLEHQPLPPIHLRPLPQTLCSKTRSMPGKRTVCEALLLQVQRALVVMLFALETFSGSVLMAEL
jgi:hypothetical protein